MMIIFSSGLRLHAVHSCEFDSAFFTWSLPAPGTLSVVNCLIYFSVVFVVFDTFFGIFSFAEDYRAFHKTVLAPTCLLF